MNLDNFATFEISYDIDRSEEVNAHRNSMAVRCFVNSHRNVTFLFKDGRTLTAEEVVDAWCETWERTSKCQAVCGSLQYFVDINTGKMEKKSYHYE